MNYLASALLMVVAITASGCVALPALGAAALSSGAGSAMKAGTDYTFGGSTARTFSASLQEVHDVTLGTLQRLGVKVTEEEKTSAGLAILRGEAIERTVSVTLEPVTPAMTRVTVGVRAGLGRDRTTATELLAQTERALESRDPVRTGRR